MVIKPLRPDVHVNKKLFPVADVVFLHFIFCLPAATLTGKKKFVRKHFKPDQKKH